MKPDKQRETAKAKTISTRRKAITALALVAVAFIWFQSTLPQNVSAGESGWVMNVINNIMSLLGLDGLSHNTVRKLAHVTEFAGLSFLLSLCYYKRPKRTIKTIFTGFTVAFLDESIQLFSGRGSLIQDVWIDLIGVAIGTLVGIATTLLFSKRLK